MLEELFGYEIARCEDPQLYFQLMALQVGALANPEAQEQLLSIKKIKALCELCEERLSLRVQVQQEFLNDQSQQNRSS